MTTYQEQIDRLLEQPLTDYAGNTLSGVKRDDSIHLYLDVRGESSRTRMIGVLQVHPTHGIVYVKREKEEDKQRNLKAWSVPKILMELIDWIVYTTPLGTYRIDKLTARQYGQVLAYQKGADSKLYIPIRHWQIKLKDEREQRLLNKLGYDWYDELKEVFARPYMEELRRKTSPALNFFDPLRLCSFMTTRVVLLGEEPLPGSNALAWGTIDGVIPGASSVLMMDEVAASSYRGNMLYRDYTLQHWAAQGVLLINSHWSKTTSTEEQYSWELFTMSVLERLIRRKGKHPPLVVMLWGEKLQRTYKALFDPASVAVICLPSPITEPECFYGCDCFTAVNSVLRKNGSPPIRW